MSTPTDNQPAKDHGSAIRAVDARQATPGMGVRYVLVVSTLAAVAIMAAIYLLFFQT